MLHKDLFGVYRLSTAGVILDYEKQTNHSIIIKTTDNGNPSMSFQQTIIVEVFTFYYLCTLYFVFAIHAFNFCVADW